MDSPNRMALDLVDEAIDFADELRVGVRNPPDGAAVVDAGVDHPGGVEAGLLLAEVATGGLATVGTRVDAVAGAPLTHVELATDHPALALLGCQSPTWSFEVDGATARAGGPARLFRSDDPAAEHLDDVATGEFAVLALESARLPDEALLGAVAEAADLPTTAVFAVVAPAGSVAGSVAAAARAGERAVGRLADAGVEPATVRSVVASAPVAPVAGNEDAARERAAAAVSLGGRVHLVVDGEVPEPEGIVGEEEGERVGPAQATVDVVGGPTHVVGAVDEPALADALGL